MLLDTHLLIWALFAPRRLSRRARQTIEAIPGMPLFSPLSIAETAIKFALGKPGFGVDPLTLRRGLIDNGYAELPLTGAHAAAIAMLPPLHRDPFDRMLIAQARVEGVVLLTADPQVAAYGAGVRLV